MLKTGNLVASIKICLRKLKKPQIDVNALAFVIPWYGDNIIGGAEAACNYLAHSLQKAGQNVEVLTTCTKDSVSDRGKNTIAPGVYLESGIKVRRFAVRENRDVEAYVKSTQKIQYNDNFTIENEKVYFREDINSPEMYSFIRKNKDRYRGFIFIPYMYGIIYNGSSECMDKSIMIPCLHDESFAYMQVLKDKMSSFKGMFFNSEPEYELAKRLYDLSNVKCFVTGLGVDTDWADKINSDEFKEKYNIDDDFILYAGRKDEGKKAGELIEYFIRLKKENPAIKLKLVFIGGGNLPVEVPTELKAEIIDLGFVSIDDKHNAFAAATVFCNPSHVESFSFVIMESWIARRPVLVSGHCEVTKHFCIESNGGLYYNNYEEFSNCVESILANKQEADTMGENGYYYVLNNFTHDIITEKYLRYLDEIYAEDIVK